MKVNKYNYNYMVPQTNINFFKTIILTLIFFKLYTRQYSIIM